MFFLFGSSSIIRFLSIVSYERPFTIQICEHLNIFRNNNKVPSLPMQNGKVDGNRPRTHAHTHTCTNLKVSKTLLGLCIDVCVCVCLIVLVCVGACRLSLLQIWLLTSISFMSCPVSFPLLFLPLRFHMDARPLRLTACSGCDIWRCHKRRNRKENETRNKRRKIRTRIRKFHANTLILLSGKFAKQANFSIYNQTKWGRQEEGERERGGEGVQAGQAATRAAD